MLLEGHIMTKLIHAFYNMNRLSLFLCDTLYVAAASNKQRGGHARPTHKNPSKLKRVWRAYYFSLGVPKQPTKAPFFFIWWAVRPISS